MLNIFVVSCYGKFNQNFKASLGSKDTATYGIKNRKLSTTTLSTEASLHENSGEYLEKN